MTDPTVSVVVVSHGRPDALARCLRAVFQLRYPQLEVVVVADAAGLAAIAPHADQIKTVRYDAANISVARNHGIAAAGGDVVAFLDDDAVPEPSWLTELIPGFALDGVGAVGGFTRGRNGISFQWTGQAIDRNGESVACPVAGDAPAIPEPRAGYTVRSHGTNMAFRRDALTDVGGFDPAFAYYLDEGDLHMRLAQAGWHTAYAPRAEVHHGFLAGPYRTAARMPKSLFHPYRSQRVFIRKWGGDPTILKTLLGYDHARLSRHLIAGTCEPRDLPRLMRTARDGWAAGRDVTFGAEQDFPPAPGFHPLPEAGRTGPTELLTGRWFQAKRLRRAAADRAAAGAVVTLFLFDPTARYHHVRYRPEGYWEQTGGLFGRAIRTEPVFRFARYSTRFAAETARIAQQRMLNP